MSKAAAQKNIQNRVVYLTDLFYIYDEIKRKHNFEEAMKYKDFWASLTKKDENTQTLIEHNVFNLGKIFKLKDSQMLIDNSNELYEVDSSTKDFLSEVENLVKKADKIVLVTKPSTLNLLLLDEVLNILQITRETRTIYYIPVETLKSDFLNEKCFFMSHSNKDNILISDDVMQGMENIEKYINESNDVIEKFFGENYITKIVNKAYLYAMDLEVKEVNENKVFENDNLYNLESLQRDLFLRNGITYKNSYKALEYLYSKGLITYYETNIQTLHGDKKSEIIEIFHSNPYIKGAKKKMKDIDSKYFDDLDDSDVQAIIPTTEVNKNYIEGVLRSKDFDNDELETIYKLICSSLKCIFNENESDVVMVKLTNKATILDVIDFLMVCGFTGTEISYMLKDSSYINENGYIKKNEEKKQYILDHNLTLGISEIYDFVKELRDER